MVNLKHKSVLTSVLVSGLFLSASAIAKGHGHDNPHGNYHQSSHQACAMKNKTLLRDLNLTDDQKSQVKSLMKAQRNERHHNMEANIEQHQQLKEKMHNVITADKFDEVEAKALLQVKASHHQQKMLNGMKTKHQIYRLLTPQQQAEFKQRMSQCASHSKGI